MCKASDDCKTTSTIPITSFGQISFRTIVACVGSQCLGHGKCASKCNITNGEGWKFTRADSIHSLCICTMIEDGMGCQKLGWKVQKNKSDKIIDKCIGFSWI